MTFFNLQRKTAIAIAKDSTQPNKVIEKQVQDAATTESFLGILRPSLQLRHSSSQKILQTDAKRIFNIDITFEKAIHGYLALGRRQRASLLVFNFQCTSRRGGNPLKELHLKATLKPAKGSPAPKIIAHAPFADEEAMRPSEIKVEDKYEFEAEQAGGKVNREHKIAFTEKYYSKGASATIVDPSGTCSGVWWNIKQSSNPHMKDDAGIPSNHRFAVLVTRAKDDKMPFKVEFEVNVHAGLRFWHENGWTHELQVTDLEVNPRIWTVGDGERWDRERLGVFQEKKRLVELTKVQS